MQSISFTGNSVVPNQKVKAKKSNDFTQSQVANTAAGVITTVGGFAGIPILNKMIRINRSISANDSERLFEQAQTALRNSGLGNKVTIKPLTEKSTLSTPTSFLLNTIDSMNCSNKIKSLMKSQIPEYAAAHGKNAFFNPATNEVLYNPEKFGLTVFHEIGHGMNKHLSKIGKVLQASRTPAMALAGTIATLGIAAKSKSRIEHNNKENDKPEGFGRKTLSFIRDNAGKLSFAAMLPVIVEEGLATYKGNKLAKSLLSPEMFKKVRTANALGLATYVISAVAMGVGAWAGVKIKDKMVANKIAKQEAKAQQANA